MVIMTEWSYKSIYKEQRKKPNQDLYVIMYNKMRIMALSTFEYEGLPEEIEQDTLEKLLYDEGQVAIYKHKTYGIIMCKVNFVTHNMLGVPLTCNLLLPNGENVQNLNVKDVAIFTDSQTLGHGRRLSVGYWCSRYCDVQSTIDTQLINQNTPLLMLASERKDVEKLKSIIIDTVTGAKALVIEPSLVDKITTMNFDAPYNVPSLMAVQGEIEKRVKEDIGIDSMQTFGKKSRLIVDEQESNDEVLSVMLRDCLNARRKGCKQMMKLYGYDVKVGVITPERITADTDTGNPSDGGNNAD